MVEVLVGDRRTNRCHESVISAAVGASELAEADQKSGQKALKYRRVSKKCTMVEVLVGDRRTNRCHQSVISTAVGASELAEADQKLGQKSLKHREVSKNVQYTRIIQN